MKLRRFPFPFYYLLLIALLISSLLTIRDYLKYSYWDEKQVYVFEHISLPHFINYLFWSLFSYIIYNILYNIPSKRVDIYLITKQILIGIFISFFHEIITTLLFFAYLHFSGSYILDIPKIYLVFGFIPRTVIMRVIEYTILVASFLAFLYYESFRDKELKLISLQNQLVYSQLNALKMQLHPHFLFNALNSVSALMTHNTKDAQKVLSKLSELLRIMLDQNQKQLIPLKDELTYIKSYLDIEQIRFQDRLIITYEIEDNLLDLKIPNLILQPLVENAIKHGFSKKVDTGLIEIKAKNVGKYLVLTVKDDGLGFQNGKIVGMGIGLKNTKERLKQIYKDDFSFELLSSQDKGVVAKISLPNYHN